MFFYKIKNTEKNAWWVQDQFGYDDDEKNAGWWSFEEIKKLNIEKPNIKIKFKPNLLQIKIMEIRKNNMK